MGNKENISHMVKTYVADTTPLEDVSLYNKYYNRLSEYRKQRTLKYKNDEDKRRSVAAGIVLQAAYLEYTTGQKYVSDDISPDSVIHMPEIIQGKNNKPFFENSSVFFNISHSGERVMCVIGQTEAGCDVERYRENNNIARRFFTDDEYEYIKKAETANELCSREAFTTIWSMKESLLKATGQGVAYPLNEFSVIDSGGRLKEYIDFGEESRRFFFKRYRPDDEYAYVACCTENSFDDTMKIIKLR